jgi:hypothetical protein
MPSYSLADRPLIIDDATGKVVGWRNLNGTLSFAPTFDTAPTATVDELNSLAAAPATMTTVSTVPASGSCAVQLALKTAAGAALSSARAGTMFVSSVAGAVGAAVTSLAALTNGTLVETTTGHVAIFSTTAAGLIGITLTAAAGTYYLTIIAPNGALLTTSALVVNA